MSIPVWIWPVEYPVKLRLVLTENVHDLGGGDFKTIQHETPFTGYDGTGQSVSRKGRFVFPVRVTRKNYAGDEKFKDIMRFLQARKYAKNESFYFYNPAEYLTPDPTGVVTTGRYLVKFLGNLEATWVRLTLWDFADLVFKEVRA